MKKKLLMMMTSTAMAVAGHAGASEIVYVPINPSFGGNPLNGSVLLNSAQATKRHEETSLADTSMTKTTPLQAFNESLERAILSRLAASATAEIFNEDGSLKEGTVTTNNFTIVITDVGDSLMITTTDRVTGASTSFQVGQL